MPDPGITIQPFQILNFIGIASIPSAIIGVAWRLSSRLTKMEVSFSSFAKHNDESHTLILSAVEKHTDKINNQGKEIATLKERTKQ